MPKLALTLRRPLGRIEIIKKEDIQPELEPLAGIDDEEIDGLLDELIRRSNENDLPPLRKHAKQEKVLISKPVFAEEFQISDSNQPVSLSLAKVPDDTLPLDEVKKEVQAAYDKGFVDGQRVTGSTFEMEIRRLQEWIRNFDLVTSELKHKFFDDIAKLEDSLVTLATMVAGHILGHETSANSEIVVEQCRKAIATLTNETIFKIYLHPDNIETLRAVKSSLVTDPSRIEQVALIADPSIDKMGCMLETSAGTIDARLSTQLAKVRKTIENASTACEPEEIP